MLYDNDNRSADSTLAAAVRYSYNDIQPHIPEREQYYVFARLQDMIDFTRPTFNKAIKTTPDKKIVIKSKYPLVKLNELVDCLGGLWTGKKPPFVKAKVIRNTNFTMMGILDLSNVAEIEVERSLFEKRQLQNGDIIIEKSGGSESQAVGRAVIFNEDSNEYAYSNFTTRLRVKSNSISPYYLHLYLCDFYNKGYTFDFQSGSSGLKNLNLDIYLSIKIPLPPLDIQQQIVSECAKVDEEYNSSRMTIEDYRKKIQQVFENLQVTGWGKSLIIKRLGDVCDSYIGLTYKPEDIVADGIVVLRSSNIQEGQLDLQDQVRVKTNIPDRLYVKNGDVLVCVRNGSKRLLGKAAYIENLSEPMTFGAFMAICRSDMGKWIYLWMQSKHYTDQLDSITATISINQLTQKTLLDLNIPILPLAEQQRIVAQVEQYEAEIRKAQAVLDGCPARKKNILDKYLK